MLTLLVGFSDSKGADPSILSSLICRNPLDILATRFMNCNSKAFLSNPFDVLLILRYNCCLVPGSFIPVLHSGHFQHLFCVHPFWVSSSTLSLVKCFLTKFPFCCATPARWVIFLLAVAANSLLAPQFPQVRSSG
jgi:hypothetical protein